MYLKAHLGWLRGYPLFQGDGWIDWVFRPACGELTEKRVRLDREALRKAEFAVRKLLHQFGRAFPQVVEAAGQWPTRARQLLDRLKAAIHQGDPLPAGFPESLAALPTSVAQARAALLRTHPALQGVCDAFSWLLHFTPAEAAETVGWLATHATDLSDLLRAYGPAKGIPLAVTLWGMARGDGADRAAKLLHYLADPASHTIPVDGVDLYLKEWANWLAPPKGHKTPSCPEPPSKGMAPPLLDFLEWLAGQPARVRSECLDLFNLLLGAELTGPWQTFWPTVERGVREAKRINELPRPEGRAATHAAHLRELAHLPGTRVGVDRLVVLIRKIAVPANGPLRKQALRTLPLLPLVEANRAVRAAFLWGWLDLAEQFEGSPVTRLVGRFHAYLASRADPAWLAPWGPTIDAWQKSHRWAWMPDGFLCANAAAGRRMAPILFGALRVLCEQGIAEFSEQDGEHIGYLVEITGDVAQVVSCFLALAAAGLREDSLLKQHLGCAYQLSLEGVEYGRCVKDLQRFVGKDRQHELFAGLSAAAGALREAGLGSSAGRLAAHEEYARLEAVGQAVTLLRRLGDAGPPIPEVASRATPPAWGTRYPAELHPALNRLAALSPRAEALAKAILSKEFPAPEALGRELAAIEERLQGQPGHTGLAKRRAVLAARLATPPRVSPLRLEHLRTKLELAADRLLLERWLEQTEDRLRSLLARRLQVPDLPEWLLEQRHFALLVASLELRDPYRELALRLFRLRCGPPPWTFHDEPANQQFLARLRALGVNPDRWLDPPPDHWVPGKNGRLVQLCFEKDPLEVLRMGEHFGTCLSPGSFNFFSAVANAVDVNKQVIYARDNYGRVVGRCLIALTDSGRLLTFNAYSHEPDIGLGELVGRLVERLAEEMGTQVARLGTVPPLVAPEWYDDGPHDLCHRFRFLDSDSSFRQSLSTLPRAQLLPALKSACAPLPLNEVTLPLFLELPELDQRPELVLPLLPTLGAIPNLPRPTWWRAGLLAHLSGQGAFAGRVLNRHVVPELVKTIRRLHISSVADVLTALAQIDPSTALRVLRLTRPKNVCDDEDETDLYRRHRLADAHERLGRAELARRLRKGD
jgi:hypothetical protein